MSTKSSPNLIFAPHSLGELIDKITVLEIKEKRIQDKAKLKNVKTELKLLKKIFWREVVQSGKLKRLTAKLKKVNEVIWLSEDKVRGHEKNNNFDSNFVMFARAIYKNNDQRALLKKEISQLLNSQIVEEKSYET